MENQTNNSQRVFLKVTDIKEIGEGMRVCIDFVDILDQHDSLYVGNTGHGYVQVLSENRHSPGYPPRPFRINCGAYHQYLYQEEKSRYLHEVSAGEEMTVTSEDADRILSIGRVKIEKRPLLRIECEGEHAPITATLQKSTSVHVIEEIKGAVAVVDLQKGDKISCLPDTPGRHLGEKIDEFIIEK